MRGPAGARAADPADWRAQAACLGDDTDSWFISKGPYSTAQPICARCPVRAECLYEALQTEPANLRFGMWGGLSGRQRHRLPALPTPKAAAIAALRELLDTAQDDDPPTERTQQPMTTAPSPTPAPPAADVPLKTAADIAEKLPLGRLLKWGDEHPDPDVRDQAERARLALAGLRQRHVADQELNDLTTEREQLEKRLAELQAREAELAPAKKKTKRKPAPVRDYDTRTVRAWANANGIDCPRVGQLPKQVLVAWRTATTLSAPPS
ncbi:WhiB family transcriptional regulator [Streptomyces sp. QTS52]